MVFLGARAQQSGAAYMVLTSFVGWNTGLAVNTPSGIPDRNFYYALGGGSAGFEVVKIPFQAGESIFICFSAAGWLTAYFDLPTQLN